MCACWLLFVIFYEEGDLVLFCFGLLCLVLLFFFVLFCFVYFALLCFLLCFELLCLALPACLLVSMCVCLEMFLTLHCHS